MKKLSFLFTAALLVVPALADELQSVSADVAIQQYKDFWKQENPDPANHVVWKIYVFRAVPPHRMPETSPEYIIAGLTSYSKKSYYVGVRINQLYNWLQPIPKRGDVIVVSGRLLEHRHGPVVLPSGTRDLDYITMDLDGASSLPKEHFDPA
ncbi:MAG TPA: hypothetical protein VMV05_06135, partial [bacterium]|nr:hypothetical protein [bacterium]